MCNNCKQIVSDDCCPTEGLQQDVTWQHPNGPCLLGTRSSVTSVAWVQNCSLTALSPVIVCTTQKRRECYINNRGEPNLTPKAFILYLFCL